MEKTNLQAVSSKVKFQVVSSKDENEKRELTISGKTYTLKNPYAIQVLNLKAIGMLPGEGAFLRTIAMSQLPVKRLEASPSEIIDDASRIISTDKYIDEFDVMVKIRLIRIDQKVQIGQVFHLKKKNTTAEEIHVTTDDIVPKIKANQHIICQLKPGKEISAELQILENYGYEHATYSAPIKFFTRAFDHLQVKNPMNDYYNINQHLVSIQSDNLFPCKDILNSALDHYIQHFSQDSIMKYSKIDLRKHELTIWYPKQSYQFGLVIQMTIPLIRNDVIMTFTDSDPTNEGLLLRFLQPTDEKIAREILMEVAKFQYDKYNVQFSK